MSHWSGPHVRLRDELSGLGTQFRATNDRGTRTRKNLAEANRLLTLRVLEPLNALGSEAYGTTTARISSWCQPVVMLSRAVLPERPSRWSTERELERCR